MAACGVPGARYTPGPGTSHRVADGHRARGRPPRRGRRSPAGRHRTSDHDGTGRVDGQRVRGLVREPGGPGGGEVHDGERAGPTPAGGSPSPKRGRATMVADTVRVPGLARWKPPPSPGPGWSGRTARRSTGRVSPGAGTARRHRPTDVCWNSELTRAPGLGGDEGGDVGRPLHVGADVLHHQAARRDHQALVGLGRDQPRLGQEGDVHDRRGGGGIEQGQRQTCCPPRWSRRRRPTGWPSATRTAPCSSPTVRTPPGWPPRLPPAKVNDEALLPGASPVDGSTAGRAQAPAPPRSDGPSVAAP